MSPSPEDQQIREDVVSRITQVVKSLWHAAVVGFMILNLFLN